MNKCFKIFSTLIFTVITLQGTHVLAAGNSDGFNFRFHPIPLLLGSLNLNLDVAVSDSWTVGPQIGYTRFKYASSDSNFDLTGYSIGARGNWFKNGAFTDGLYLAPAITFQRVTGNYKQSNGSTTDVSANGPNVSFIVGYGWFWSSFNMMLGLGAQAQLGDSKVTAQNSDGTQQSTSIGTGITGEYSLGWTF